MPDLVGSDGAEHLVWPWNVGWLDLGELEQSSESERIVEPESAQGADAILNFGARMVLDLELSEIGNNEEVLGVISLLGLFVAFLFLSLGDEEAILVAADSKDPGLSVDLEVELGREGVRNVCTLVSPEIGHGVGHLEEEVVALSRGLVGSTEEPLLELPLEDWVLLGVETFPPVVLLEGEEAGLVDETQDRVAAVLGVEAVSAEATQRIARHVFDHKVVSQGPFDAVAFPLDTFGASHLF